MQQTCSEAGLPQSLLQLVWIRASQLNRCAFCLDLHSREAREHGESLSRLDVLPAWRDTGGLFTQPERAALALTESLTLLSSHGVPDAVYDPAAEIFTAEQMGALIMSISVVNAYNRLGVATAAHPPHRS